MDFDLRQYRALVTGASGVLGLRLSEQLLNAGAEVVGFDLDGMSKPLRTLSGTHEKAKMISGNMLDMASVYEAVRILNRQSGRKRAVFHLSAMSDANQCDADPEEAFRQNVEATVNLMQVCSQEGVQRVIFPSTAYVYGSLYNELIKEEYAIHPESVYPLTKLLAEQTIQGYGNMNVMSCDIVRISNIYGSGSKSNTILGTIMFQAEKKGAIFLQNLKPVRDFIYIDDVVDGLSRILLAGDEPGSRVYNLSTGKGTSVGELARVFCQLKGLSPEMVKCSGSSGKESRLVLSNDLLERRIGWKPRYSVLEGIQKTINEWAGRKYAEA